MYSKYGIRKSNPCLLYFQVEDQSPTTDGNCHLKKLKETTEQISRNETSLQGVECKFEFLSQSGNFLFHCSACDQKYKAGPAHQNMQNLRLHIQKEHHKSKVSALRKAKGLGEETSQKVLSEEAFKELEKQFPGQFLLKSTTAVCRDCLVSNRDETEVGNQLPEQGRI